MARLKSPAAGGAQTQSFFQRPGELLGRTEQLEILDAELEHQRGCSEQLRVCEITGLGGMGKSRLLDEVMAHARERPLKIDHVAFVSLEGELSGTEVGVLLHLRDSIKIDCYLFDAAVQRYWRAVGQPVPAFTPNRIERSVLARGAEIAGVIAGIPLPVTFAAQIWKTGKAKLKERRYKESEFKEIDGIREEPRELRALLPRYLALDLQRGLKGKSLAIFYDSYEKQEAFGEGAPWLQEMIWTLRCGVHVIASREPLGWRAAQWKQHTTPVRVAELSEQESQEMLQQHLGEELTGPVEQRLLEISRHTPFYIESAVNLYLELAREREVEPADLPSTPRGAVTGLLDHRRAPQRALATALATVQVFDQDLYQHMADVLNVELAVLHYQDFVDSFLVERVSGRLYKLHDLLTEVVRDSPAERSVRSIALEAATNHLLVRCQEKGRGEPEAVLAILRGLLDGWMSVNDVPRRSVEALIDIAYVLYDAGFSNELMSLASATRGKPRHSISLVVDFFAAMSTRRAAGVEAGIRRFEDLKVRKRRLGRHAQSLELELAYLRELRGNYRRARNDFRRIARQVEPFDPGDRTQLRALLYHGDVLIMDGKFREGSRILQETCEAVGYRNIVNWGELVRHRAHAYRFSFLLEDAAEQYQRALRKTPDAPVLTAKLYTNLVETYCWSDPDRALKEAVKSIELNERIGHQIELAKCAAARGIALARLGNFPAAKAAIDAAKTQTRSTGYPAGLAFALQAEAIASGLDENTRGRRGAMSRLRRKTEELGTYDHLTVAPLVAAGAGDSRSAAAEWLEPDGLEARIRGYLDL